ncbi:MAG: MIP/aquaporin family protein [Planctomycetota bacterium]|jgi:glycerol uptake facilitator protein
MNPYVAELIGTAILLLLGTGVVANVVLRGTKGHSGGWIVISAGWGFAVFAGVATADQYSGAHLNPAVAVGLAAAGTFDWGQVPGYIGAQLAGAFIGATLAYLAYYKHYAATDDPAAKLGTFATAPAIPSAGWNVVTEALATFVLVLVCLYFTPGTAIVQGSDIPVGLGSVGALPVAFLVFGIGLSLGGPTGYAINPARDLAPRVAHAVLPIPGKGGSDWGYAWVPVVGPLLGGLLAAGVRAVAGG